MTDKIAVFGNGGREAAIAQSLSQQFSIYGISTTYINPTIQDIAMNTDGQVLLTDVLDSEETFQWMTDNGICYAIVQQDNMLAEGLVDSLRSHGLKVFGASKTAARLEWDKEYACAFVANNVDAHCLPETLCLSISANDVEQQIMAFVKRHGWRHCVVKPNVLAGGKGVKVGDEHFENAQELDYYAKQCLEQDGSVLLQERIEGYEFTIMGITDGEHIVFCNPTYDYPYRFAGDKGPGTGGMGCITMEHGLPFLSSDDVAECHHIMKETIHAMAEQEHVFKGCINGGFFKTDHGIKFMEYNARLGDPEAHNALLNLGSRFPMLVKSISDGNDISDDVLNDMNTMVVYLVNEQYAIGEGRPVYFAHDLLSNSQNTICEILAASLKATDHGYVSIGNSRILAVVAHGRSIEEMREDINDVLTTMKVNSQGCDYRSDIGLIPSIEAVSFRRP